MNYSLPVQTRHAAGHYRLVGCGEPAPAGGDKAAPVEQVAHARHCTERRIAGGSGSDSACIWPRHSTNNRVLRYPSICWNGMMNESTTSKLMLCGSAEPRLLTGVAPQE